MKIMITGANGHLGIRLIRQMAGRHEVVAAVRSDRAKDKLLSSLNVERPVVHVVDYADPQSLAEPLVGCDAVVHLVGIIKETSGNSYRQAHERASEALTQAAKTAGVGRVVYLSILGSQLDSVNACLASRGRAEEIFQNSGIPALVIKVPMVLGEDDYASRALRNRASRAVSVSIRDASLEQPVYAGDVTRALEAGVEAGFSGTLELAGPESLSRRELVRRAGVVVGRRPRIISLPLAAGWFIAWLLEVTMSDPPMTRTMLGLLDHDDCVDPSQACQVLGIELTPLDEMLGLVMAEGRANS